MELQAAHERFTRQLQADGRSPHTIAQYHRHVALLGRWLAQRRVLDLADLSHEDLAEFLCSPVATQQLDGKPRHATTMNALRSSLKGFFTYLHAAGHLPANPTALTRRAVVGPPEPRSLSESEQLALLAALDGESSPAGRRDRALFGLLLGTGLRLGSALALVVEDVDLRNGELQVHRLKGNRRIRLPISTAVSALLTRWIGDRRSGPLFPGREGRPLSRRQVCRRLAQALEGARVARPASPHALRHSFAMGLYARTRDVGLVQKALTHRSIESTMVYARVDDSRLRVALG